MAYFAQIDENGYVQQVISVSNNIAIDPAPNNSERLGQDFINSIGLSGTWKQTSYNGNFRKQYAGINYRYDADADVFIEPQPHPSWTLDANYDWQPPVPRPDGEWYWDENSTSWINNNG